MCSQSFGRSKTIVPHSFNDCLLWAKPSTVVVVSANRSNEFKEDDAVWKGGEDGGVGGGGPMPTGPNNLGPTGGYVAK